MNIAIINEVYWRDRGIPNHIRAYVNELKKRNVNIAVFATDVKRKDNISSLQFIPIKKTHHILYKIFLFYRELKEFIADKKIDVMHVHDSVAFIACFLIRKRYGIPVVFTCHATVYQKNGDVDYSLRRKILYRITDKIFTLFSNRLIAISTEIRDILLRIGAKKKKIVLIPGLLNRDIFTSLSEPKILNGSIKKALFVGGFRPIKGIDYLIKAIPEVKKRINEFELILAGSSTENDKNRIRDLAVSLGINDNIKILGFIPQENLKDIYRGANIFVLPSLNEAQSLVVLEAMSHALPIVASNVGGIPDVIKDGENGLLVKPGNSESIAEAIIRLLTNKDLYKRCSNGAVEYMKTYPREQYINNLIKVYDSTINSKLMAEKEFHNNFFREKQNIRIKEKKFYEDGIKKEPLNYALSEMNNLWNKEVLCYGQGRNTSILLNFISQGANVTSIDISGEAVKMVGDLINDRNTCKVIQMDAENMVFKNDSFDVVFGRAILHHLDINKAGREIARVLRPGGRAIFIEPLGNNPLISLYRHFTPSDRTKDEHPLKFHDFLIIKRYFKEVHEKNFFLFSLIAIVFRKYFKKSFRSLLKLDDFIFKAIPFLSKYAWCTVITLEK